MANQVIDTSRESLQLLIDLCLPKEGDTLELPPKVNWPSLVSTAHFHGLSPLLYHKLKGQELWSRCPEETRKTLLYAFAMNLQRTEAQRRELVKITRALTEASIPVIPYKGCFLSQLLYGDPYVRVSSDIDIIIPRENTREAWHILTKEMGYQGLSPARGFVDVSRTNEYNFKVGAKGRNLMIEVHWEQVRSYNPLKIPMERIWERTTTVDLWGTTFHVPDPPIHFLMLVIHAVDDNWPVKSLVDLASLSTTLSPGEWEDLKKEAHQWSLQSLLEEALERIDHLKEGQPPSPGVVPSRKSYGKTIVTRTLKHTNTGKGKLNYLLRVSTRPSFRDYDLIPGKKKSRILATLIRPYRLFREWLLK